MSRLLLVFSTVICIASANDTGECKDSRAFNSYGKCVDLGCCESLGQSSDSSLCSLGGVSETCCYKDYTCGYLGCINVAATWMSRYSYSTSFASIDQAFADLKQMGISRVYFNVFADGSIYARSQTAEDLGVNMVEDRLAWATQLALVHGLELYAWFEYGSQVSYIGASHDYLANTAARNWLLCHNPSTGCNSYYLDNYSYLNLMNDDAVNFLADMTADVVRNYPTLDGFQYDDHYGLPEGFSMVSAVGQTAKYDYTRNAMVTIRDKARAVRSDIHVSYSPSRLDAARLDMNVDWENFLEWDAAMEIVPQYYYDNYNTWKLNLDEDSARVDGYENGLVTGIRLSGSSADTPHSEVDRMIQYAYDKRLRGVSYWYADDLLSVTGYNPKSVSYC